eukprot:6066471-Prymnesium_polylepis.1
MMPRWAGEGVGAGQRGCAGPHRLAALRDAMHVVRVCRSVRSDRLKPLKGLNGRPTKGACALEREALPVART